MTNSIPTIFHKLIPALILITTPQVNAQGISKCEETWLETMGHMMGATYVYNAEIHHKQWIEQHHYDFAIQLEKISYYCGSDTAQRVYQTETYKDMMRAEKYALSKKN